MQTDRGPQQLQTTARSLEIVEIIKRSGGATVGELVEELGLSKSTIHNHLATLRAKEYVVREANTYHLGLRFFHLGEQAIARNPSYEIISGTVMELAEETSMEVDFSVEEYGRVIVIFDEMGSSTRRGFQIGQYYPIYACASGKAILAELPDEEIDDIIDAHGLTQLTANTITERDELFETLRAIRDRGYAINDEESNSGIKAVARTVHGPMGDIIGGLSITDPAYRFPPHYEVGDVLKEACENLEKTIEDQWHNRMLSEEA
jgi:DNA-binding IclR family transcriptional regulator